MSKTYAVPLRVTKLEARKQIPLPDGHTLQGQPGEYEINVLGKRMFVPESWITLLEEGGTAEDPVETFLPPDAKSAAQIIKEVADGDADDVDDGGPSKQDYRKMSKSELQSLCIARGIEYKGLRKGALIDALNATD